MKIKIGIIGCGAIGSALAEYCTKDLKDRLDLVSIYDISEEARLSLEKTLNKKIAVSSLDELIGKSDLLIESASGSVSHKILKLAIDNKKDVIIMSIGGLLGHEGLLDEAGKKGIKVYLPSGALAGIDAFKACGISKIESVRLTTRKPPKGLLGAPYLKEKNIDITKIDGESVVFEGNAAQAVKGFPKNVNVSALLSIAGLGSEKTIVRIITSDKYTKNSHEVEIKGDFGTIKTVTENVPFPENPKTSYLAALSAMATLRGIVDTVRIGT